MNAAAIPDGTAGRASSRRVDAAVGIAFAVAALGASILVAEPAPLVSLIAIALPPALLFGFLAAAARYPCRAMPLRPERMLRIGVTQLAAGAAVGTIWALGWRSWTATLQRAGMEPTPWSGAALSSAIAAGAILYLMAAAVHYLLLEMESAGAARQAALRYEILARDAELRSLKSQIDPHFLYNSLNAVASLCGSNPAEARRMAQRLADFFRGSLRVAPRRTIPLEEELSLASAYLEIEKVRFGDRLAVRIEADLRARQCMVPPLILQPLIENAVRHGIGPLLEGGTIEVGATVGDDILSIRCSNPADPDRAAGRGEGIGIANVRGRLAAIYDDRAELKAEEADGWFRASLVLPAETSADDSMMESEALQ